MKLHPDPDHEQYKLRYRLFNDDEPLALEEWYNQRAEYARLVASVGKKSKEERRKLFAEIRQYEQRLAM